VRNSNLARKSDTNTKDRYEKELGQLPEVEARPFRAPDVAALIDRMRRLERTMGRLTSAFIFLTIVVVVLGVADHWPAVRAAFLGLDQWRQLWLH
jgi:hypothetical protein